MIAVCFSASRLVGKKGGVQSKIDGGEGFWQSPLAYTARASSELQLRTPPADISNCFNMERKRKKWKRKETVHKTSRSHAESFFRIFFF